MFSLKACRINAGLTQEEASNKLGIAKTTLINYEKGTVMPRLDLALEIAKLYGVTLNDINFFQN